MEALRRANQVRTARAALKRKVTSGERDAAEVIRDCPPETETMTIFELLRAQRHWGNARTRSFLNFHGLPEKKMIGTLTQRQVKVLIGALAPDRAIELGYEAALRARAGRAALVA
jgi:hypothetical protein